ncbi:MAG TPA: SDR family oxidoreductase [Verrucomicrobiae bacterium]|nr:SDR family oxidoreductase [Verrucomicrobiae bacterium]
MDETVLITGASSGIGRELARCFAGDQSRLILVARNTDALATLAAELRLKYAIEVHVLTADLSRPETPQKIFADLSAQKIAVDILVNNAGFGAHGAFAALPLPRQLEMIRVNVAALTELTGLFLPAMLRQNRGGILNVASVAGFLPGPEMAVYYASKAFVLSFTEALAAELSATNLKICALCPGPTDTNFGKVARGEKMRAMKMSKLTAETVALCGHRAFRKGKVLCVPGWKNQLLIFLVRLLPRSFVRQITAFYNRTDK